MFSKLNRRNAVCVLENMAKTDVHNPASWIPAALYNSFFSANVSSFSAKKKAVSEPSFDLDLIMEHARNVPLKVRCSE